MKRLKERLDTLDRKPYGAYKKLKGTYSYGDFKLIVDHVQGDPFARPSRVFVRIPFDGSRFPADWLTKHNNQVPLGDYLTRLLHRDFMTHPAGNSSGNGGRFFIPGPGQQILPRSSVGFEGEHIIVRFRMGLPAFGRSIDAAYAQKMFYEMLPTFINSYCFCQDSFKEDLQEHIVLYNRQLELRSMLADKKLIGFIPNGAALPRESGSSDLPLRDDKLVPFGSPPEMEHTFLLKDGFSISGMGIKEGVNLIVGGGFHGKSTLLQALERGIYPHIKGDGREYVCALENTVKIRAENGRVVNNVNIKPFIDGLPQGMDTSRFATSNASGSTSQAAGIVEAVSAGAGVLLMDEDTCATNFMIRDEMMRALIADAEEPITPFLHRVEELYRAHHVSTVLVMGGSGDYFSRATDVIGMKNFLPQNMTARAHAIAASGAPHAQEPEDNRKARTGFVDRRVLVPDVKVLGRGRIKVRTRGLVTLSVGKLEIDIRDLEQLVCVEQVNTLGYLLWEVLKKGGQIRMQDLKRFTSPPGDNEFSMISSIAEDFAGVRYLDLMSVINRAPGLDIQKAT
jgi:predicted ABC-class ATPase